MPKELVEFPEQLKLESHNSMLTNQRIHDIERTLDLWSIRMHQEPTQEHILGCYSIVVAWFSYVKSMLQDRRQGGKEPERMNKFEKRIVELEAKISKLGSRALFIQKRVMNDEVRDVLRRSGEPRMTKYFWNLLESEMVIMTSEVIDEMRLLYQSVHFYFRISKTSNMGGVLGDLLQLRQKKGTLKEIDINSMEDSENGKQDEAGNEQS